MKKLLLICTVCLVSLAAMAGTTFHGRWNFTYPNGQPMGVREFRLQPIAPYGINETNFIPGDYLQRSVNALSSLTISNLANGRSYRITYIGPNATTVFTNSFDTNVTGLVNATAYAAVPINDGASLGYSQIAADGRFHNVAGDTSTNAEFRGTLKIPIGPMVLGYVWTLTNITTGAGEWQEASGGGGGTWGSITGTLSDQTDLQSALDAKQALNAHLTDLADGTLTGSKVGSGINAANITAGTLPDGAFPSPLPELDGINIVNLNGSEVANGTVAAAYIDSTIARDSEVTAAIGAAISDTAFGAGWNGVTTTAPSKNAVYDAMVTYVPLIGGTMTGEIGSTLGTITTDISTLDATATWNNSGVTFCGVRLNYITTANAADSTGLDVQFDSSSVFSVRENLVVVRKNTTATGARLFSVVSSAQDPTSAALFGVSDTGIITATTGIVDLGTAHDITLNYNTAGFAVVKSAGLFGFSSGTSAITAPDAGISRTAAGTIAIGNGTAGNASGTINAAFYQVNGNVGMSSSGGEFRIGAASGWSTFELGVDSGTTPSLTGISFPDSTGSDNDGINSNIDAGNGTGSGGSGSLILRTAPPAGSSSTANTMEARMTIKADGSVNIQKTLMLDQSTEPTPGNNQAGLYAADVAGSAELFAVDEPGNEGQLTSHPGDMPTAFFVITNFVNVMPKVSRSIQRYAGTVEWVNESLMAVVKQMEIRGTFAGLPVELRNQIADGLHLVESFKEYEQRTGKTLTQRDWAADQQAKQAEYDQKRASLLADYQKPLFEVVTEEVPGLDDQGQLTTRTVTFTNLVSVVNTNIQVPPAMSIEKAAPQWLADMTARNDTKAVKSEKQ